MDIVNSEELKADQLLNEMAEQAYLAWYSVAFGDPKLAIQFPHLSAIIQSAWRTVVHKIVNDVITASNMEKNDELMD